MHRLAGIDAQERDRSAQWSGFTGTPKSGALIAAAIATTLLGCSVGSDAFAGRPNADTAGASMAERRDALRIDARKHEELWRRTHEESLAVEALGLLEDVVKLGEEHGCELAVRRVLLSGEIYNDPEQVVRSLRDVGASAEVAKQPEDRVGARDPKCGAQVRRVLRLLAGYGTSPDGFLEGTEQAALTPVTANAASSGVSVKPAVRRVESYASRDTARLVVHLSEPAQFAVGELTELAPGRWSWALDLQNAVLDTESEYAVGGVVERVRLVEAEGGVRAVFELNAQVVHRVFYLPEPFRLVVDVFGEERRQVPIEPGRLGRVVLDAGHGGHDTGAKGVHGLLEKDVVLDVAHRAAPLIARELGASTLLTRDDDMFVPLDERVARANAFGADLFVSIHCNANEDTAQSGVMTFVLDHSKDDASARIAARENAASSRAATELTTAIGQILNRETLRLSGHFAGLLQRSTLATLVDYPNVRDGGVRRAGFYVLAGAQMPAVLFEMSFISNAIEEDRLAQPAYRQALADALVNAIRAYREGY